MPFQIRSRGRPHLVRAGTGPDHPMYRIGGDWVPFETLPPSIPINGDGDFEVMQISDMKGLKAPAPHIKPVPKPLDPRVAAAIHAPAPEKSKTESKPIRDGKATMSARASRE